MAVIACPAFVSTALPKPDIGRAVSLTADCRNPALMVVAGCLAFLDLAN
jgi:hypothetical protein